MAPLAAAAAVILVATASVALTHGWFGSGPAGAPGPGGTPPYYVSLASYTRLPAAASADATVRSTATGGVLARVAPPRPYSAFTVVSGAADDSTFVLGAERAVPAFPTSGAPQAYQTLPSASAAFRAASMLLTEVPHSAVAVSLRKITLTQFFMLRLDSNASSPRLTMLQMAPEVVPVAAAALSPDGRKLAVALAPPGRLQVRVTDLATYATHTWQGDTWAGSWPAGQRDLANEPSLITLSWAGNRTLAMDWPGPVTLRAGFSQPLLTGVSLLNTAASGSDLAADSTTVIPPGYLIGYPGNAMVTPDDRTIVSSGLVRTGPAAKTALYWKAAVAHYSASSGALGRQPRAPRFPIESPVPRVLWTNSTGSVVIISTSFAKNPAPSAGAQGTTVVGVLAKDMFTPLRGLRAPIASVDTNRAGIAW